jgi:hypothetical protein
VPKSGLEAKVKTALDETRLLILGSQILFGFQLNGSFQEGFGDLSSAAKSLAAIAFALMAFSVACLVAPSMQHQLVEKGDVSVRLHRATGLFAAIALLPFSVSLGISFFVVLERQLGDASAASVGGLFTLLSLGFWFGIERLIGKSDGSMGAITQIEKTPLHVRIEQMLTEARILLPGAQALLGFQFAMILTRAFEEIPPESRVTHTAGLCLVALAVILLITPAALHRISFGGEDTDLFYRMGSRFVLAASIPLALGISCDVYVVVARASESTEIGMAASATVLALTIGLWWLLPLAIRFRRASLR